MRMMKMSLLENAFRWEKKPSKLRIEDEVIELRPTTEEDEEGVECAAWEVLVNEQSTGYVLYCTTDHKFFHLEKPKGVQNAIKDVRTGVRVKLEDTVISMLKTRYPAEFVEAV